MTNYDVKNILKVLKKHTTIRKKLHCTENITETFYSEQGIYQVTNKDIFKLNVITESSERIMPCVKNSDIPCAKNSDIPCAKNSDIPWILDKTCFSREKVYQMPVDHVKITLMQYIFSQSPESKVKFVVEMLLINDGEILLNHDHGDMFLREKNIVDFYFDISVKQSNDIYCNDIYCNDIYCNDIPWQEINEFLLVWK
jgi:hypothetical protein